MERVTLLTKPIFLHTPNQTHTDWDHSVTEEANVVTEDTEDSEVVEETNQIQKEDD